jgi:EmrB/QacA subfamily drug resistance transporter
LIGKKVSTVHGGVKTRRSDDHRRTFAILATGGFAFALMQSMVAPALPDLQRSLGVSTSTATWILTSYLVSAAVLTPILGRLGDVVGRTRVLLGALACMTLGAIVSALAHDAALMIAGRVVQGTGGAILPLSFGIIKSEFPATRVPVFVGITASLTGVGASAATVIAGPLVELLSYHWLFWLPGIVAFAATVAGFAMRGEPPEREEVGRTNWLATIPLATWLVALMLAISEGTAWGWLSARTVGLVALAAVAFAVWVALEWSDSDPLVDMRTMRSRAVACTNAAALMMGVALFCAFVLISQYAQAREGIGFGSSVSAAGLFLLPMAIGMLAGDPLSGRLSHTYGNRSVLAVAAGAAAAGLFALAVARSQPALVYGESLVLGLGLGAGFAAMANLVVESVPPAQTAAAAGMNNVIRMIGAAIGGQVAAAILAADGFTAAFAVTGVVTATGTIAALLLPTASTGRELAPAPVPSRSV